MGPSEEADAEFEKELAKMMTDTSAESRRVDRKTALALWESAALPTSLKKKRVDDFEEDGDTSAFTEEPVMNFTLITKRGKQQQVSLRFPQHTLLVHITLQPRPVKSLSLRSPRWPYRHAQPKCRTGWNNSS
jgi:regulator of nonsense transcripts 2